MRLVLVATLLATGAVTGTAHASAYDYHGGCTFATVEDAAILGSQDTYHAVVRVVIVPVDPRTRAPSGATVAAQCELVINGVSQGIVLDAGSGTGAVAGAGRFEFSAAIDDRVIMCDVVTIGGETARVCGPDVVDRPLCPEALCGQDGLLDQAVAAAAPVIDEALRTVDPTLCPLLVAAADTVDSAPTGDLAHIDPGSGDTYLFGDAPDNLFWDCPPYVS